MAISVTDLGHNSNASGATVALTSLTVPAGALIVVGTTDLSNASSGGSVADTPTNSYTSIVAAAMSASSANGFGQVFYAKNALALSSGSITYTKQTSGSKAIISALYATGIDKTAPLDSAVTASATGTSTAPSVTSGSPSQAGELFVGWVAVSGSGAAITTDSGNGWASPLAIDTTQAGCGGGGGNQVNAGTGTKTHAPSLNSSQPWADFVVGFKPPTGGLNNPPMLPL